MNKDVPAAFLLCSRGPHAGNVLRLPVASAALNLLIVRHCDIQRGAVEEFGNASPRRARRAVPGPLTAVQGTTPYLTGTRAGFKVMLTGACALSCAGSRTHRWHGEE